MFLVSIPDWSDWQERGLGLKAENEIRFNSRLVRLAGSKCARQRRHNIQVSIPDWSDWQMLPTATNLIVIVGFNSRLVRLAVQWNKKYLGFEEFQFQIGPIGRHPVYPDSELLFCFNSRLVRLAADAQPVNIYEVFSFNSRLVRLAATSLLSRSNPSPVSIPDWSDWQRHNRRA